MENNESTTGLNPSREHENRIRLSLKSAAEACFSFTAQTRTKAGDGRSRRPAGAIRRIPFRRLRQLRRAGKNILARSALLPHETRARPGFAQWCPSRAGPTYGGEGSGVGVAQ